MFVGIISSKLVHHYHSKEKLNYPCPLFSNDKKNALCLKLMV
jgi:hypothetical protein